jgi:hypothetical protein
MSMAARSATMTVCKCVFADGISIIPPGAASPTRLTGSQAPRCDPGQAVGAAQLPDSVLLATQRARSAPFGQPCRHDQRGRSYLAEIKAPRGHCGDVILNHAVQAVGGCSLNDVVEPGPCALERR